MTRVAAILAAVALVLLLGSNATGDTPPTEYRIFLPEAYRAPVMLVPTALVPCPCGTTATPNATAPLPPPFSMTVTPRTPTREDVSE
jgi:hypothetical protein